MKGLGSDSLQQNLETVNKIEFLIEDSQLYKNQTKILTTKK